MKQSNNAMWIILVVVIGAAAAAWLYRQQQTVIEATSSPPAAVVTEEPAETGPIHPLELPMPAPEDRELVPLPPLDDLNAYLRLELVNIFGDALDALLADDALIDKIVATVDNLPRSRVAERIRPVGKLESTFITERGDGDDEFILSAANFERYTFLIEMIQFADTESMTDAYRRYYPALQKAYVQLGYPDGYFNDRVVEVIDHLLETPRPDQPIRLTRPQVLYEFADPDLEALSSGQKFLLRIGDEQADALRNILAEFRVHIASD